MAKTRDYEKESHALLEAVLKDCRSMETLLQVEQASALLKQETKDLVRKKAKASAKAQQACFEIQMKACEESHRKTGDEEQQAIRDAVSLRVNANDLLVRFYDKKTQKMKEELEKLLTN